MDSRIKHLLMASPKKKKKNTSTNVGDITSFILPEGFWILSLAPESQAFVLT